MFSTISFDRPNGASKENGVNDLFFLFFEEKLQNEDLFRSKNEVRSECLSLQEIVDEGTKATDSINYAEVLLHVLETRFAVAVVVRVVVVVVADVVVVVL